MTASFFLKLAMIVLTAKPNCISLSFNNFSFFESYMFFKSVAASAFTVTSNFTIILSTALNKDLRSLTIHVWDHRTIGSGIQLASTIPVTQLKNGNFEITKLVIFGITQKFRRILMMVELISSISSKI